MYLIMYQIRLSTGNIWWHSEVLFCIAVADGLVMYGLVLQHQGINIYNTDQKLSVPEHLINNSCNYIILNTIGIKSIFWQIQILAI